jgi:hypothetical protein
VYCGQCGSENNEEAGTCAVCGAPLLITAGARACQSCGASLGDNDQFCPSCGAPALEEAPEQVYSAEDAFGSIDPDDIVIDDLPEWLREMAPGQETPDETPASDSGPELEDLPDWLRETDSADQESPDTEHTPTQPQIPPSPSSQGVHHQPAEQFSLVSEDDLPEWLRALGDDEPAEPSSAEPQATTEETRSVAMIFEVPQVSRAWMSEGRRTDPDVIAAAREEFSSLGATVAVPSRSAETPDSPEPEQDDHDQPTEPIADVGGEVDQEGSRLPIGMIAKVATLIVLLIIVGVLAFIFIQGL